jgi:hypothetical protein
MNTDKRVLTDEQRQRKNELSRLNRLKKKDKDTTSLPLPDSDSVPEPDVASPEPEPMPSTEDLERKRKDAIAEKGEEGEEGEVSKWKIEHAKVVADVEPMLATIKTFDCNRLYWLAQHMAQQKRKCLDLDSTAQMSLKNYSKWICTTRTAGKLSRDVSSELVEEEESEEEEEDEESEEEEEEDADESVCIQARIRTENFVASRTCMNDEQLL